VNLIEGGREGKAFQDIKDFFYYSMIRSKDENTTKTRKLDGTVPLCELANLMRAMGYYPTQMEVTNMENEVQFSHFAETGQKADSVDLNTFIRLFVNHRPVYGIGKNNIEEAFKALTG
jgi:Ca2+-binding EF-hand superfamily protein